MTVAAKKQKGRKLQQDTCAAFLSVGSKKGLVADDIKSTSMGCSGVDMQVSPAARAVLGDWAVECKRQEALNVTSVFWQHWQKYKKAKPSATPILVHRKNHTDPLVTMTLAAFVELLDRSVNGQQENSL
jgi:hypothetical protein